MRETTVARVYAETLLELTRESGQVDAIADEVDGLRGAIEGAPELGEFLESPNVSRSDKKALLRRSFAGRVSDLTLRFLDLVVDRERQDLLLPILAEFGQLVQALRNQEVLRVTSAVPLDETLRSRLRATFA
nr:ATP synthase F1 subunit delta [Gemmatimonadota bacterium]